MFDFFKNVSIEIGDKVVIKAPNEHIRDTIQTKYGGMLDNLYQKELEIK